MNNDVPKGVPGALNPAQTTFLTRKSQQNKIGTLHNGGATPHQVEFKTEDDFLHVSAFNIPAETVLKNGKPVKLVFSISREDKLELTGKPVHAGGNWYKIEANS